MAENGVIEILEHILNAGVHDTGDHGSGGECPYCRMDCSWNDELGNMDHEFDCIYLTAKRLHKLI